MDSFLYYCCAMDSTIQQAPCELASQQTNQQRIYSNDAGNLWTTRPPIQMKPSYTLPQIWFTTSTQIFISECKGLLKPSNQVSFPWQPTSWWTAHPPQWCHPHLVHHPVACHHFCHSKLGTLFLNEKEAKIMCLALNELGHRDPQCLSVPTMTQQWELSTTLWKSKIEKHGNVIFLAAWGAKQNFEIFNITQGMKILQITLTRDIQEPIIRQCACFACTCPFPPDFYTPQLYQACSKGALISIRWGRPTYIGPYTSTLNV